MHQFSVGEVVPAFRICFFVTLLSAITRSLPRYQIETAITCIALKVLLKNTNASSAATLSIESCIGLAVVAVRFSLLIWQGVMAYSGELS